MRDSPMMGCSIVGAMFAMAGIPPFINFIAKLQMLEVQINTGHYELLAISLVYSIMSLLYTSKAIRPIFQPRIMDYKPIKHNIMIYFTFTVLTLSSFFYSMGEGWIAWILTSI
jgi:NADH:ubiquinone oxidoreductase subunit 2 (subunit N)